MIIIINPLIIINRPYCEFNQVTMETRSGAPPQIDSAVKTAASATTSKRGAVGIEKESKIQSEDENRRHKKATIPPTTEEVALTTVSASTMKLYIPFLFVAEGNCRHDAMSPKGGGGYISLRVALRALVKMLMKDWVSEFDQMVLRDTRARLHLGADEDVADVIMASFCDAEAKEHDCSEGLVRLAVRTLDSFVLANEEFYYHYGIAERYLNEDADYAPAYSTDSVNDGLGRPGKFDENSVAEEFSDPDGSDGEFHVAISTTIYLPFLTKLFFDDYDEGEGDNMPETISVGAHLSIRSALRAVVQGLHKFDSVDQGAISKAKKQSKKNENVSIEEMCVARFDELLASGTEIQPLAAAQQAIHEITADYDGSLVVSNINESCIDESVDKTEAVILM
jgi:hypothetical protein